MDKNKILSWKKRAGICIIIAFFGLIIAIYMKTYFCYAQKYQKHKRVFGATYMTMNNQFYKVINNEIKLQVEENGDHLIALDPALDSEKLFQPIRIPFLVNIPGDILFFLRIQPFQNLAVGVFQHAELPSEHG